MKLRETVNVTSYTPPSPIKATPTRVASDSNDVSTASVSKAGDIMMTSFSEAGDVMMTSSDQKGKLLKKMNFTPHKDPQEGKNHCYSSCDEG